MIAVDYAKYKPSLRLKKVIDEKKNQKRYIFGAVRKKWLVLQPEELVRQLTIHYFIEEKFYPINSISVEKGIKVNNELSRRCDILVYDENTQPFLLVECKAPQVDITDDVFEQIAAYNLPLQVKFLMVTNGVKTYCCEMNYEEKSWRFLNNIPPVN